jgi:hypothetical protein
MVFRFLNASTADGHNPYRLTRDGFDWEVLDPDDPWSYVGYWGDHQVVYLLRLLETSARFHPGRLAELLDRRLFTYAEVPYRIRPYEALLADPRDTIDFDARLDRELRTREQGAYLLDADGEPLKVPLAEKLLLVALARLANYVPGAGIWLNTQRPEWNDANNALVGYGASMVTLYHLRRYLAFCRDLFDSADVSVEVATLFRRIAGTLAGASPSTSDRDRRAVLDGLATAASDYREKLYAAGLSGRRTTIARADLRAFCDTALGHVDHSIRANRRPDGLYHAYNLLSFGAGAIGVRHLYEMLEGQVAVLSSGALGTGESAAVLDALRTSALYRADQNSYLLYPDRTLPRFLDRNVVPAGAVERSPLLSELMLRGDRRVLVPDVEGGLHFDAALHNAADLGAALSTLAADPDLRDLVERDRQFVLDLYEQVFDHQSFTGRSGTFYKYEGLGCVYWHMVSKLLLAIHEILEKADPATAGPIRAHYEAVRDGIGVHKSPRVHGAIPVDPYSHTPGFAGAQQPGMTGQVKEDILTRIGELGVTVAGGRIRFRPDLVRARDFLVAPRTFGYVDVAGARRAIPMPAGAFGFTLCQVPVVVHRGGPARLVVTWSDGTAGEHAGLELDEPTSAAIFDRAGSVSRLDAHLSRDLDC